MSVSIKDQYEARANAKSVAYPGGSFKNESTEGANDGTPWQNVWSNDELGFRECILSEAGATHNGTPDSVSNPHYLTSLKSIVRNITAPPQATPADVCAGYVGCQICDPNLDPNKLDFAGTIIDSCLGWDRVTGRPYLLVLNINYEIYPILGPWVYNANPSAETALSLTYSATPDHVAAICSDADYLYVMWCLESGNWIVSKFAQTDGRYGGIPLWNCDTGIAWSDEGLINAQCLINANATKLACFAHAGVAGSPRKIVIVDKATGAMSAGTGSYVSGYGDSFNVDIKKLVSDGTHVWWLQYQSSAPNRTYYLMSAKISNPSTSDYASKELSTVVAADKYTHPRGLLALNDNILFSTPDGNVGMYSTVDDYVYAMFDLGSGNLAADYPGDQDVLLGFDGCNALAHFIITDAAHSRQTNVVRIIPAGMISYRGDSGSAVALDANAVVINIDEHEDTYVAGKLIHDKVDIWLMTRGGKFRRIANPGVR